MYEPWVKEVVEFGDGNFTTDCFYPRGDQLFEMPRHNGVVWVKEIRVKPSDNSGKPFGLGGIQFVYVDD